MLSDHAEIRVMFSRDSDVRYVRESQAELRHDQRVSRHLEDYLPLFNPLEVDYRCDCEEQIRPPPADNRVLLNTCMTILFEEFLDFLPGFDVTKPLLGGRIPEEFVVLAGLIRAVVSLRIGGPVTFAAFRAYFPLEAFVNEKVDFVVFFPVFLELFSEGFFIGHSYN